MNKFSKKNIKKNTNKYTYKCMICEFCNKKHLKNKKCNKEKKIIGSAPIHLAYTSYVLDSSIMAYAPNLYTYLNTKYEEYINEIIEDQNEKQQLYDKVNYILNNDAINFKIILFMKYDIIHRIKSNPTALNNDKEYNNILGHAFTYCNHSSKNFEIINLCLHKFKEDEENYLNYLNIVTEILSVNLLNTQNTYYSLSIQERITDKYFFQKAYNYIENGFLQYNTGIVGGINNNNYYLFTKIDIYNFPDSIKMVEYKRDFFIKTYYIFNKTLSHFILEKNTINYLRLMPYMNIDYNLADVNGPLVEYGGSFKIINISDGICFLSIDETITGQFENTNIPDEPFTFHTHPIAVYLKYNVCIGTPSTPDIRNALNFGLKNIENIENNKNLQPFHIVVSIEGIYVIKYDFYNFFQKCGINFEQLTHNSVEVVELQQSINKPNIIVDYPFDQRFFDWNNTSLQNLTPDFTHQQIYKYKKWLLNEGEKTLLNGNNDSKLKNLLTIEYYSWKTISNKDTIINLTTEADELMVMDIE